MHLQLKFDQFIRVSKRRYPFDVQQCQLTLSMRRAFDPFTQLIAQNMRWSSLSSYYGKGGDYQRLCRYLGPTSMTKYDVISTKMEVFLHNHDRFTNWLEWTFVFVQVIQLGEVEAIQVQFSIDHVNHHIQRWLWLWLWQWLWLWLCDSMTETRPFLSSKMLLSHKGYGDLGKEATWCAPQRLCPHHHPQPDRLLHQLLQGEISET